MALRSAAAAGATASEASISSLAVEDRWLGWVSRAVAVCAASRRFPCWNSSTNWV
jgi:hypothetical protein